MTAPEQPQEPRADVAEVLRRLDWAVDRENATWLAKVAADAALAEPRGEK